MKSDNNRSDPGVETRKTIVHTARRLFLELGYRAVTTRRIAEACGLTQPALYHHFANKEDLYVAVHQEMLTAMRPSLERIIKRGEGLDDTLTAVVRYLLVNGSDDMSMLFHDLEHELALEARNAVRDLFRENVVAPISAVFSNALDQGRLRGANEGGVLPVPATYLLLSMIDNTTHMPVDASAKSFDPDQAAAMIVGVLLHGLSTTG